MRIVSLGVALRLAANAPDLTTELLLLDAGVLASTRSIGVTRAMRIASIVARLADAHEPESVEQWMPRVRTSVTVLVGGVPHAIGASADELALLRRIPGTRVQQVSGVGHFVHEEAPRVVLAAVIASRARQAVAAR